MAPPAPGPTATSSRRRVRSTTRCSTWPTWWAAPHAERAPGCSRLVAPRWRSRSPSNLIARRVAGRRAGVVAARRLATTSGSLFLVTTGISRRRTRGRVRGVGGGSGVRRTRERPSTARRAVWNRTARWVRPASVKLLAGAGGGAGRASRLLARRRTRDAVTAANRRGFAVPPRARGTVGVLAGVGPVGALPPRGAAAISVGEAVLAHDHDAGRARHESWSQLRSSCSVVALAGAGALGCRPDEPRRLAGRQPRSARGSSYRWGFLPHGVGDCGDRT